jgi:signal transduction histidine kinase
MVRGLLDLTRLQSGDAALARQPLDLAALARSSVERFALLAEGKGVVLSAIAPDPVEVSGDGDRLMQVLTNLIDNALRHTDRGGKVTVSTETVHGLAHLTVTDTGRGIPKADLPRLFERFYQVDKSRSRDDGAAQASVGLGLAISSEVVRAHGGRIEVDSIVGVGSRFTVVLPRPLGAESASLRRVGGAA